MATPSASAWALAGFAFNPLFLLEASSPTEWAQAILLMMGMLYCAVAWLRARRFAALAACSACACALVLSRPDAAMFCVALLAAVLWEVKLDRRTSLMFFAASAVAGVASIGIFIAVNGGPAFLLNASSMIGPQNGLRRVAIALLGFVNVFGVIGCLALLMALGTALRNRGALAGSSLFEKLCLVAWPMMIVRFALLPDKLEYLLLLIPLTLLALASRRQPVALVAIVACSLILNALVAVSLFERKGPDDRLAFALRLNKGALLQDWDDRKALRRALDPQFTARIAAVAFAGSDGGAARLTYRNYALGYTSDGNDLILSDNQLYKLDNSRFPLQRFRRSSYRRVIACDQVFFPDNVGWRVLQPPQVYVSADMERSGWLRCQQEDRGQPPALAHEGIASR